MDDIDIACPNCSEILVLDLRSESREVVCPNCDALVQMPRMPASKEDAARLVAESRAARSATLQDFGAIPNRRAPTEARGAPPPQTEEGGIKRSIPIPRSDGEKPRAHAVDTQRAFGASPAGDGPQALATAAEGWVSERSPSHLPEKRGSRDSAPREVPPPAASIPAALDLHKMERGGLHGFACPGCGRPIWIKKKDSGAAITCENCSSEIAAPDLESGAGARLLSRPQTQPRARTVLPEHRHTDRPVGERIEAPKTDLEASGKADLPAPRPPEAAPKMRLPVTPGMAPPPAAAPVSAAQVTPPGAAPLAAEDAGLQPANFRLGENRRLRLTPKGEVEGDPEVNQAWGVDLDAAELRRRKNRRLIVASVALALPLVGVLIWFALTHHFNPALATEDEQISDGSKAAEEVRRAVTVTKTFLSAPSVEEQAKYVRHSEVTAARMAEWHQTRPFKPHTALGFDSRTEEQTIEEVPFVMLFVTLDDHSNKAVALEKTGGDFKVDWESYVAWSAVNWDDFLSKEPPEPHDMRVIIRHDTYYNFYYSDPGRYFCYKLVDPDNSAHCFAYTGLESEAGQKISQMIRRQRHAGAESVKAILKLRFEPAARGHLQAWIDDVVQDGWVKIHP